MLTLTATVYRPTSDALGLVSKVDGLPICVLQLQNLSFPESATSLTDIRALESRDGNANRFQGMLSVDSSEVQLVLTNVCTEGRLRCVMQLYGMV